MRFHRHWIWFAVAALLVASGRTSAAPNEIKTNDPVLSALDARVAQFLEGVSLGQSYSALQDLLSDSQLLKQTDALKDLAAGTNDLEAKYGPYRAFEQIAAKRIGADLVLMRYLYKCENFPVVWRFAFYRTPSSPATGTKNGAWRVIAVRFDTDLDQL